MKNIRKIRCEICKNIYSSVGMASHLKDTHFLTVDDYVKIYEEFRLKNIKLNSLEKTITCKICNENLQTDRALSFHLKTIHNISRSQYMLKYFFNNIHPTCKCGCGNLVKLSDKTPYYRTYISGHNPNPMLEKKHSEESKKKMSDSAILRLNNLKNNNQKSPMHYRQHIFSRVYSDINVYLDMLQKRNIEFLSTIDDINSDGVLLKFKCNSCDTVYSQTSLYIICRNCVNVSSLEQKELVTYIKNELHLDLIENDRKILNGLELDIFIPSKNIAIEYNGLYWHSEVGGNKNKTYHLNKLNECEKMGIKLITIFSDEWIHNTDIVKNRLKHILLRNVSNKIYARNCNIKEISILEKKNFLNKFHIQGNDKSKIKLGAFYNDELVAVMTFSNLRIALGNKSSDNTQYEMARFATNYNYHVIGISGKLLKYFIKNNSPSKIISYADRRWSSNLSNNLYKTLGFSFIGNTQCNYWYTYRYKERLYRFNFTKHSLVKMGADPLKSEWDIMKSMGYDRVWDCGNLKYELVINN